jgi:uncharacterized membrane protein
LSQADAANTDVHTVEALVHLLKLLANGDHLQMNLANRFASRPLRRVATIVQQDPKKLERDSRSAPLARKEALRAFRENLRAVRIPICGLLIIGLVATVPLLLWSRGDAALVASGVVIGLTIGAAAWIVATISGASNLLMGVVAEDWTEADLRQLGSGWNCANNFQLGRDDIDHVLVSAQSLWVLETKWMSQPLGKTRYTEFTLSGATSQVRRSEARARGHFARWITPESVHAAVVIWTPPADRTAPEPWRDGDGTYVVPGNHLKSWLENVVTKSEGLVDAEGVWTEVCRHSMRRDEYEAAHGRGRPASLSSVVTRSLLIPSLAFVIAAYLPILVGRLHAVWVPPFVAAAEVVVGWKLRLKTSQRFAATACLAGGAVALFIILIIYLAGL